MTQWLTIFFMTLMAGRQRGGRRDRYVFFFMDRLPMSGPTVLVNGAWKQRQSSEWESQPEPAA